jgi:serine/threonine protein kinase
MQVVEVQGPSGPVIEKRLSSRERELPEARDALRAEAQLLQALRGRVTPRLVFSGDEYFRMEKVLLPTLEARLTRGASTPEWVAHATRAAFEALATLHEAADSRGPLDAVHGDLSPANLAIDDAGDRVVLLDLGLAVSRDAPRRDGAFRGTVGYVAPEVARGAPPTPTSDLYSLAATLLHAASGKPPRALSPTLPLGAAIAAAAEEPIDVAAVAGAGGALAAIARCLAHEPADRPETARAVLAAL